MTAAGPLTPIGPHDLEFVPVATDFAGLAADSLSSVDNLLLAIDAGLIDMAASYAAQTALSSSLDGDLADMSNQLGAMNADDFDSALGDLASAAAAGDTLATAGDSPLPIGDFFNTGV